jgi:hypothetical protein
MKIKILLVLIAATALLSFDSCVFRAGGHMRGEGHERGRSYVQPANNGLQNVSSNLPGTQPNAAIIN